MVPSQAGVLESTGSIHPSHAVHPFIVKWTLKMQRWELSTTPQGDLGSLLELTVSGGQPLETTRTVITTQNVTWGFKAKGVFPFDQDRYVILPDCIFCAEKATPRKRAHNSPQRQTETATQCNSLQYQSKRLPWHHYWLPDFNISRWNGLHRFCVKLIVASMTRYTGLPKLIDDYSRLYVAVASGVKF